MQGGVLSTGATNGDVKQACVRVCLKMNMNQESATKKQEDQLLHYLKNNPGSAYKQQI